MRCHCIPIHRLCFRRFLCPTQKLNQSVNVLFSKEMCPALLIHQVDVISILAAGRPRLFVERLFRPWKKNSIIISRRVISQDKQSNVMLSAAKHLSAERERPFATLRVTDTEGKPSPCCC